MSNPWAGARTAVVLSHTAPVVAAVINDNMKPKSRGRLSCNPAKIVTGQQGDPTTVPENGMAGFGRLFKFFVAEERKNVVGKIQHVEIGANDRAAIFCSRRVGKRGTRSHNVQYILTNVGDWNRSRRRIPRYVECFPVLPSIWTIAWYVCFAIMRNLRGNLHFTPWVNV
jgi:hypothetical protein